MLLPPVFVMMYRMTFHQWLERVPFWLWQLNTHLGMSYPEFVDKFPHNLADINNIPNYLIGEQSFRLLIGETFLSPEFVRDEFTPVSVFDVKPVTTLNVFQSRVQKLQVAHHSILEFLRQEYLHNLESVTPIMTISVPGMGRFFILRDYLNEFPVEGIGAKRHYATLLARKFNAEYYLQADNILIWYPHVWI